MKERLYVIATRGPQGKELYLAVDESRESKNNPYKIYMKWTDDIDEAMTTFTYTETNDFAEHYFKNYKKWYITDYMGTFK